MMILDETIVIETATIANNILWYIVADTPYIYGASINDLKIVYKYRIFNDNDRLPYMYYSIKVIGDKLCLIPFNATDILVVDINDGAIKKVKIPKQYTKTRFCGITVVDKYVFSYGLNEPVILRFDTNLNEVDVLDLDFKIMNRYIDFFGETSAVVENNKLFVLVRNTTMIIELDPRTLQYTIYEISDVSGRYFGLYKKGPDLVCTPETAEYPVLYLDKNFYVKNEDNIDEGAKSPVGLLPNQNKVVVSLDETLKIGGYRTIVGYAAVILFDEGFFIYNKKRNGLRIIRNDGETRMIFPKISISYDDIKGNVIDEKLMNLEQYMEFIEEEYE